MGYFTRGDDEALRRQLDEFEQHTETFGPKSRREYVTLVLEGEYARHKVRQTQAVIEEGRPWPLSFPNAASLLGHFETYSFRLACGPSRGSDRREFWETWERGQRDVAERTLPGLIEKNFEQNVLAGTGVRGLSGLRPQDRTETGIQELLSRRLAGGDLITALKVALRMSDEGIDGGVPAIRHLVAVEVFRHFMSEAKSVSRRVLREADDGGALAKEIVSIINRSGVLQHQFVALDVIVFWTQCVDAFIDAVAEGALPVEFR